MLHRNTFKNSLFTPPHSYVQKIGNVVMSATFCFHCESNLIFKTTAINGILKRVFSLLNLITKWAFRNTGPHC